MSFGMSYMLYTVCRIAVWDILTYGMSDGLCGISDVLCGISYRGYGMSCLLERISHVFK